MLVGNFAMDYIARRMKELGHGDNYLIQFRHLLIPEGEIKNIDAVNQLFIILEADDDVLVSSSMGNYDLLDTNTTELYYEHQGKIKIENRDTGQIRQVKFLQVIPKNKKQDERKN